VREGTGTVSKALLLKEKGWEGFAPLGEEGKLVAHHVPVA